MTNAQYQRRRRLRLRIRLEGCPVAGALALELPPPKSGKAAMP